MIKLFIDAGHNDSGWNTGAVSPAPENLREQDVTYAVSKCCSEYLKQYSDIEVKLSRPTKNTVLGTTNATSLSARSSMANTWGADYFISIHCNAGGGEGSECFYTSEKGREFGTPILESLTESLQLKNRGMKIHAKNLHVLTKTNMPAVLLELAFLDNRKDLTVLSTKQKEMAIAVVKGIAKFLGKELVSGGDTVVAPPAEPTLPQEGTIQISKALLSKVYSSLNETEYSLSILSGNLTKLVDEVFPTMIKDAKDAEYTLKHKIKLLNEARMELKELLK